MTNTQTEDARRRYDREGVLKDGETFRAPLLLMDAAQEDAAAITRKALADAYQPSASGAGHRPGTIVADGIQAQLAAAERQVRRDLRLDAQQDAWKGAPDPAHSPDIKSPQTLANKSAPGQEIDLEDFHQKLNAKKRNAWKGGM
jgi:hypothetical protein